ncbi:MAG: ABC-type transport auxiliary lipoprotein family protein [Desulfobacterales bacterium]
MKQINKCLILFVGLFLLLGACMNLKQPAEKIEYYALEYPSPQIDDLPPLPYVLRVDRFTTSSSYNTSQMIYRDRSFKRKAYIYHKWQTTPGALVTALVNRDMKNSGLFKAILSPGSRFSPSYIIEGTVDEFFEWDTSDAWKAILSVSIILSKKNSEDISESILFQKTYHQAQVCRRKHPKAVAGAMSRALSKISEEMIKDVYDCLKAEN